MATFVPKIAYQNCRAAVKFLENAFGFQTISLPRLPVGPSMHAEMKFGDVDGHCETARAAGAAII
jgi:uncharacterized glyoxalase superfamily protein PhnB